MTLRHPGKTIASAPRACADMTGIWRRNCAEPTHSSQTTRLEPARRIHTPMTFITKRRLVSLVSASAMVATLAVAAAARGDPGGEAATPSTQRRTPTASRRPRYHPRREDDTGDQMFEVTRVARARRPIKAASGRWYATAASGRPTRSPGRAATAAPSRPTATRPRSTSTSTSPRRLGDQRFDWSSAVSKHVRRHKRDFIFHVGRLRGRPGTFYVSASNNAPGDAEDRCRSVVRSTITESGWYTFKHDFKNDGGVLAVEMNVILAGCASPWRPGTLRDRRRHHRRRATVGGNRYDAGLVNARTTSLSLGELDNITRVANVGGSPEPTTTSRRGWRLRLRALLQDLGASTRRPRSEHRNDEARHASTR